MSYQQESFINITAQVDDHHLRLECVNSKITQQDDQHGGVGLQNVRKRLELIYGNRYTLHIDEQPRYIQYSARSSVIRIKNGTAKDDTSSCH